MIPVLRDATGALSFVAGSEVVDWAVHMRRVPDSARADVLLAHGALPGARVDEIADRLAAFHDAARCDEATARFGERDVIEKNVLENFSDTEGQIARFVSPAVAAEIQREQLAFLEAHEGLFVARARAGRVRDCHGDLRLEHVYFEDGRLSILDCIEFNDRFRFGDVCADVAFLAMDLAHHGRVDLAERLLARYARSADDYDLYALVDFYEAYRAYVRAKIATFVAGDPDVTDDVRARMEADARRHFLLALSSGRRALLRPFLVAVGGVIASGKSTVASALASEMSAPVVDADRTRKHMLGVPETRRVDEAAWHGAYDPAFTRRVYDEVLRRAGVVLASGRSVVVDASFRSRAMRQELRAVAEACGVPFLLVECRASRDACMDWLAVRATDATVSDGRAAIFDDFVASFEPMDELAAGEHVVVDTRRPLGETLDALRARVPTWPPDLVT